MAEPAADAVDEAGVSKQTHSQIKDENTMLREQLAALKARQEVYDSRQREQLTQMKPEVEAFVQELVQQHPEYAELGMMARWASDFDKTESLDTTLGISRLIACASANHKRTREEASAGAEKATALADAHKRIESLEAEVATKTKREAELEGLVTERTEAATKMQELVAKTGLVRDKLDFSLPSSREAEASSSSSAPSSSRSAPVAIENSLLSFVTASKSSASGRIEQSGTQHAWLGSTGTGGDVVAALRAA